MYTLYNAYVYLSRIKYFIIFKLKLIKEDDIFILKFKTSESEEFDEQDINNPSENEYVKPTTNINIIDGNSTSVPATFTEKHPEQILEEVLSNTK